MIGSKDQNSLLHCLIYFKISHQLSGFYFSLKFLICCLYLACEILFLNLQSVTVSESALTGELFWVLPIRWVASSRTHVFENPDITAQHYQPLQAAWGRWRNKVCILLFKQMQEDLKTGHKPNFLEICFKPFCLQQMFQHNDIREIRE